jgi:hypothetical protein
LTKFIAVEVFKKLRGLMRMRSISFPLAKRLLVHLFIKKKIPFFRYKQFVSFGVNPPFLMSKGIGNSELAYKVNKGGYKFRIQNSELEYP